MNILVLNGSPKGEYSITLQTIRYLEKLLPKQEFQVLHVGQQIRAFEKDFTPAAEALEAADLIVFSYPVYTFLVPSQLHRFIELMKENGAAVAGKYVTQVSTSKHFYDVTAHRFIQENVQDLGMKYIRGLSADMEDLLSKKGQKEARDFWKYVCWNMKQGYCEPRHAETSAPKHRPVTCEETKIPAAADDTSDACEQVKLETKKPYRYAKYRTRKNGEVHIKTNDIVIVTDCEPDNHQLASMIERFREQFARHARIRTRIVNIREYPFIGGCLGCFHCAADGKCVYKDGFDEFLRNEIQCARAIIYAGTIRDHSMGARFKLYDDRQFCNGHRTVTVGMPVGYLLSGNYSEERNLQTVVEARAQVGGNVLAGVATDEFDPNGEIDKLAASLAYALKHRHAEPQNFYGVGGMKIFRDLIFQMQGMMKADHRFYRDHGQYDFPQKKVGMIAGMYLVGAMISNPKLRAKIGSQLNEGMVAGHKKVVEEAEPGR